MTKEEKQLLLKDLCAREPYHPRIRIFNQGGYDGFRAWEDDNNLWFYHIGAFRLGKIKILPYLRPMSSMTEEEKEEYTSYCFEQPFLQKDKTPNLGSVPMCIDWLIAHNFDYRGLIPMGLALEAPEGMYKLVEYICQTFDN